MTEMTLDDVKETWRHWSGEDATRQPRRTCSTAGCKERPTRVKTVISQRKDGTNATRKYVYCAAHVPD